jgi:hypothetical protein
MGIALGSQSSSGCVAISGAQATVTAGSTSNYIRIVGDGERGQLLLHRV